MFCSHSSQAHPLNDKSEDNNYLLLSYCQIDITAIVINLIFISILIIFILVKRKKFVDFKHLKTTPNSSPNTTITENSVLNRISAKKLHKNYDFKCCHKIFNFYNKQFVKQISLFTVFSVNCILILELFLIWHLFKQLFIIDLLSIVLTLISLFIALVLLKRFVRQRKSLFIKLILTSLWLWSLFCCLIKFVVISVNNKDQYLALIRVYAYLLLFFIYSLLAFNELANIVKPCSKVSKYGSNIELEDHIYNKSDETTTPINQIKYLRNYSSLLSKATFSWFFPVLKKGFKSPIELNDLGLLPTEETAEHQFIRFITSLPDRKNCTPLKLWLCYWKTYWSSLAVGAVIKICADLFGLFGPLSIDYIISYVNETQTKLDNNYEETIDLQFYCLKWSQFLSNGYIIAIIVLLATLLQSTFSNNFNHLVIAEGIHLKTALNCLVYDKTLRMTVQSGADIGSTVNHMSIDSYNLFMLFSMGHYLWAVPLKILLLLYLMYCHLGYSAMIGAATIFVLAPLQYYISRSLSVIQEQEMDISDERLRKTTELLMGIKFLKLLGWELTFAESVKDIREKELKLLKKDAIYVALNTFITQGSSVVVTLVTFALYQYIEGKPLTASKVFTGLALFNQLTVPLYIIPVVIPIMISAVISTRRLAKFLSGEEVDPNIPWRTKTSTLQTRNTVLINDEYYLKNDSKSSFDANNSNESQLIINNNNNTELNNKTQNKSHSKLRKISSN